MAATSPGGASRTSRYLSMRDGVRLALDVWLPAERPERGVPTILRQTRYMRSVAWTPLACSMGLDRLLDISASTRHAMLRAGYAWVDVDVRGSGASGGSRPCPWHREEVRDGAEVVDWIVAQPWSDGAVGATGVSYGGTSAELLLSNRHPAVRAVAPRFSLFDVYADVAFPGGAHLAWFTEAWGRFNALLDDNAFAEAVGVLAGVNLEALRAFLLEQGDPLVGALLTPWVTEPLPHLVGGLVGLVSSGVIPVDGEHEALREAVAEHQANFDVHQGALQITHRDDTGISELDPEATIDSFSPHAHLEDIAASGAAVLGISGWLDGAYEHAAIKRHRSLPAGRSWLVLGPWEHGGRQHVSPFDERYGAEHDLDAELVRFFDRHLRGVDGEDPAPVRYFTIGQERWKSAPSWPPPGVTERTLHLSADRALSEQACSVDGHDRYRVRSDVGSGPRSRWRCLLGLAAPVGYGDRRLVADRVLAYESSPLDRDVEVTGHPLAHLWVAADATDALLFCYLEHVEPSGRIVYVTEGQLRALHRRVGAEPAPYDSVVPWRSFRRAHAAPLEPGEPEAMLVDLLPISYRVPAGHRLRLSIAGADRDAFGTLAGKEPTLSVCWGPSRPSRLILPVL